MPGNFLHGNNTFEIVHKRHFGSTCCVMNTVERKRRFAFFKKGWEG